MSKNAHVENGALGSGLDENCPESEILMWFI